MRALNPEAPAALERLTPNVSKRIASSRQAFADYDVTADGKRFVFVMLDPEAEAGTLNAILNWTSLLRR